MKPFRRLSGGWGETGDQFEADFIDQIDTRNPAYQKALQEAFEEELREYKNGRWPKGAPPPTDKYLRFEKAIELAKKFQPYRTPHSPTRPEKPFARDIRLGIIKNFENEKLGRKLTPEKREKFKFFTGADKFKNEGQKINSSPIDQFHGVDAWLEYTDETGKVYRVTFDLTKREKGGFQKSDILVREQDLHDPHLNPDEYDQAIEQYTEQAFKKMFRVQ